MITVRKLSKREQIIMYTTGFLLAFTVLFSWIVKPQASKLSILDKQISEKEFLLEKYASLQGRGQNVRSLYTHYKGALDERGSLEEITARLFEEIQSIAQRSNVAIKKVKPLSFKPAGEFRKVLLEAEVEGECASVFSFVTQVEASPYFVQIFSLRITPQSKSSKQLYSRIGISKICF